MADYPEPADPGYVTFGRAAELIAQADPCLTVAEVLEALKRGVFAGLFDASRETASDPHVATLFLEVDNPFGCTERHHAEFSTQVRQAYEVDRAGITSFLLRKNRVPGNRRRIERRFREWKNVEKVYDHLEQTPLRDYPEAGQAMIAGIRIARGRLREWLTAHHFPAPFCLGAPERRPGPPATTHLPAPEHEEEPKSPGRPELPGWAIVRDYIMRVCDTGPIRPHKMLAYEARQEALKSCDACDTPSEATILRRMKEILNN